MIQILKGVAPLQVADLVFDRNSVCVPLLLVSQDRLPLCQCLQILHNRDSGTHCGQLKQPALAVCTRISGQSNGDCGVKK